MTTVRTAPPRQCANAPAPAMRLPRYLGRSGGGAMWEPKRLRAMAVVHRRAELFRPSPSVPARCTLMRWSRAAAVAVCFEENKALSRGWCTWLKLKKLKDRAFGGGRTLLSRVSAVCCV